MKILHFTIIFAFELFGICHLSSFRSWLAHLADASPSRALRYCGGFFQFPFYGLGTLNDLPTQRAHSLSADAEGQHNGMLSP